ncbi:MAG: CpXC domain-containing protein [Bradymonadia bacterium]
MSSSAPGNAGVFTGEVGQTHTTLFNIWCPKCGVWYGARGWTTINRATDERLAESLITGGPVAVNRCECPVCGHAHSITAPVVFHDPEHEVLALVISESDRHEARDLMIALYGLIEAPEGGTLPDYALRPALVAGADGLQALLDGTDAPAVVEAGPMMARPRTAPMFPEPAASSEATVVAAVPASSKSGPTAESKAGPTTELPVAKPDSAEQSLGEVVPDAPAILEFPSVDGEPEAGPQPEEADASVSPESQAALSDVLLPEADDLDDLDEVPASAASERVEVSVMAPLPSVDDDDDITDMHSRRQGRVERSTLDQQPESLEEDAADQAVEISEAEVQAARNADSSAEGTSEPTAEEPLPSDLVEDREDLRYDAAERSAETQVTPLPEPDGPETPQEGIPEDEQSASPASGPTTEANIKVTSLGHPMPVDLGEDESLSVELSISDVEASLTDEPTHVVAADEVSGSRRAPRRLFLEEVAQGKDRYLVTEADRVVAAIRMESGRAEQYELEPASLIFQLHQHPQGPVMSLALCRIVDGDWTDPVVWVLHHESAEHTEVLNRLRNTFDVEVVFYGYDDVVLGHRRFTVPLEQNVAQGWSLTMEAESALGRRLDRAVARAEVSDPTYERFGRLRHNFHQHSFADLITASQARLGLGILTYWSAPQRQTHLLRIRAFPEVWFEGMTARVLTAALAFGLAMEPHMRQRALDLDLAADPEALVRISLANFAEVNLNLKPNDLDPLDLWSNWEALLACAEELDIRVDEEIEELAAMSMEKARSASQVFDESEAGDESVPMEEITDLSELAAADLVGLLEEPRHRLEAAMALMRRGDQVYVPTLFDSILKMPQSELLQAVPAALAMGPAFEASFLTGLRSRRGSVRLASALFLAEIRSERAASELLSLLSTVDEAQWPVIARAVARIGRRIVEPALGVVRRAGDPGGRVAHALALLGPEARGALAAALDKAETPAIAACLERALEQAGRVSFGDAADFGERLADAFGSLGLDGVGPDYEEDMASIDLSGASVDALELESS